MADLTSSFGMFFHKTASLNNLISSSNDDPLAESEVHRRSNEGMREGWNPWQNEDRHNNVTSENIVLIVILAKDR